jgi:hypothetical protein
MKIKFLLFGLSLLFSTCHVSAQTESDDDDVEVTFDNDSNDEEEPEFEYYYDWDMPKYSLGINLNSALSYIPAVMITHDFGITDNTRLAVETGATLYTSQQQGFKLRTTYQKFFYKNESFGAYLGGGINFVSFWEPRSEFIFLENTYWRTLSEIRNQSFLAGIGEIGMSFEFNESHLFEFTLGLGAGIQRAGGSFVVIRQWEAFEGFGIINQDPGVYLNVPFYFNMSYSIPLARFAFDYD